MPKQLEILQVQVDHVGELLLELLLRAVDVRVVHLHRAHAHQAEQLAAFLVAVAGAVLGQAQRQVAVAARLAGEDLVVHRAVHRLDVVLDALPAPSAGTCSRRNRADGRCAGTGLPWSGAACARARSRGLNSISLASFSISSIIAPPFGSHSGRPGPTSSSKMKISSSLPSLRWSRFLASSRRQR